MEHLHHFIGGLHVGKILFIIVSPASWVVRSISDTASLTTIILSIHFGQSLTRTAETESLPVQARRCGAVEPRSARIVASCG